MALTNNLKVQVDLPVWEWCKFTPIINTAVSSMTAGSAGSTQRYIYYQNLGITYRYDTYSDSWNALTNMVGMTIPTIMNSNIYSSAVGHYGRAIGSGGGNNTIQLAGLSGDVMVGYTIRILAGTGAGQERTITAVANPVVADRGVVTTAGTQSIIDASVVPGVKNWKNGQWRDYQFRCDFGTGRTQMRPILYNTYQSIIWSEPNQMTVNPWAQPLTNISVAVNAQYVIESHVVTVNTNWTTNPDNTSKFVILSGGIWNITQGLTTTPFMSLSYYDILADQWYGKTTCSGIKTAVFLAASDLSMERFAEVGGTIFTETASAGGARSITPTATLVDMAYANHQIRIVGGTGIGQWRTILSNRANIINVTRDWDTAPNNTSVYEIWKDTDKVWLIGGNDAALLQYSIETDQWSTGKQLDFGQTNQLAAKRSGQSPYALTSITRTATGLISITGVAAGGVNYNVNDILTIDAKGGTCRVNTITPATGAVLTVSLEQCGTGYTAGTKTTTVTPAQGTGCTLTIAAGDIDFTEAVVTPIATDFTIGDSVTITGANGTGAAKFNGTYTIIGCLTTSLGFSYCSVGDPGAATATIAASPTTTVLVDATKAWTTDEHKGKIIQICPQVLLATTAQQRTILSNTATTITWTLACTAATPANGTYRYIIEDIKPFGTEVSNFGKRAGMGTEGWVSSGSTTTLVDNTKTWQENIWSRVAQRYVRIVEGTGVGNQMLISSNTATTLTYATQAFTPDTTTRYVIMDTFGTVAGAGAILTLTAAPTAGGTGYAVGDVLNITGGTAQALVISVGSGIVTGLRLLYGGVSGYTVVTGVATTNFIGTGVNCTVAVASITAIGSTTLFYDITKNWDVNCWVGKRVKFLSGTGVGAEQAITANTATSITYGAGTAPDVSTAYAILESSPRAYGIHLDVITGSTDTTLNHNYMYAFTGTSTV